MYSPTFQLIEYSQRMRAMIEQDAAHDRHRFRQTGVTGVSAAKFILIAPGIPTAHVGPCVVVEVPQEFRPDKPIDLLVIDHRSTMVGSGSKAVPLLRGGGVQIATAVRDKWNAFQCCVKREQIVV